jgi:hypothetical protein
VGLRHLLSAPTSFGVPQRLGWDVAETDRGLWVMQEAEPHIWFAAVRPPACHPHNLACWKAAALAARHPAATNPLRGLALSGTDDCPPPHPPRPRPAPCSWSAFSSPGPNPQVRCCSTDGRDTVEDQRPSAALLLGGPWALPPSPAACQRPAHAALACSQPRTAAAPAHNHNHNLQVLSGALVAGPKGPGDDTYEDRRDDYVSNEVRQPPGPLIPPACTTPWVGSGCGGSRLPSARVRSTLPPRQR